MIPLPLHLSIYLPILLPLCDSYHLLIRILISSISPPPTSYLLIYLTHRSTNVLTDSPSRRTHVLTAPPRRDAIPPHEPHLRRCVLRPLNVLTFSIGFEMGWSSTLCIPSRPVFL
ncbi:hypothetical protein C8R46DRAFT_517530 [Mycena filopes]|nr:hypothetical protein C8R46DRAFT_517530 [Mycena filopes]